MMRQTLVAANWKMNGSKSSNSQLINALKKSISGSVKAVVFPPAIYMSQLSELLADSSIEFGAQNIYPKDAGAFTGEVSLSMVKEFGCQYVLVGHSERRQLFGETDRFVAEKVAAILASGLTPMICIGETLDEREQGITEEVVARQIDSIIEMNSIDAFRNVVIAYEPVWAIGTGKTASPEQAQETHAFIRTLLRNHSPEVADKIQILYGGSVKASNASELFAQDDIDGGLVGGASLIAEEFSAICAAAQR